MSENENHNADPAPNTPGTILKRCREYHGMSLAEAAEATKVGANYLQALENDQVGEFANLAYLKGFLRIYASHLGLNPDDMIRLFERQYAPDDNLKNGSKGSGSSVRTGLRRHFPWQRLVLPAMLLLLMIITSAIINRSPDVPQQPTTPQPSPIAVPEPPVQKVLSSVRQAPAVQKTEQVPEPEKEPKAEQIAPEQAKPPLEAGKAFVVRLKVTQTGALGVTIDSAHAQNYDLTGGDIFEWKAEKSIALDLSNAGGVSVELNGIPLKPFGPAGTPAYIILDAHGVKQ